MRAVVRTAEPSQTRHDAQGAVLPGVTVHLLEGVNEPASATAIRKAGKRPLTRFLDPAVAEYIKKTGLYSGESEKAKP